MRGIVAAAALLTATVAGCSEPEFGDCAVTCESSSDCPSSLTCGPDNYCHADVRETCSGQPDAPEPPIDASADGGDTMPDGGDTMPGDAGSPGDGPPPPDDAGPPGDFTPSNGLDPEHLEGVTGILTGQSSSTMTIDTTDGEIKQFDITIREPGPGIKQGIFFAAHPSGDGSIFAVASIDLDVNVRVNGDYALHIVSAGDVNIDGVINLSGGCSIGDAVFCGGPGGGDGVATGNPAPFCGTGENGEGGDGAGGGGHGQAGSGGIGPTCSEVSGGATCGVASLEPLAGGGGGGRAVASAASGGGGGGAIQIASYTSIEIGAAGIVDTGINAGGAGGEGQFDGGGGGGAGGAILLEAPSITLHPDVVLAANGGGGGCGSITGDGEPGQLSGQPARGGCPGGTRPGGNGGARNSPPTSLGCEGGGGGGAGRIRINTLPGGLDDFGAVISPAPTFSTAAVK